MTPVTEGTRLNSTPVLGHTDLMQRARRHQRFSAGLAFALLALIAELTGRSLTHRLDVGRHVGSAAYSGAEYYPFLLAAVKLGVALLLARLAWRFVRAHTAARAGRRVLAAVGKDAAPLPRLRLDLSPRLWTLAFLTTSTFYLLQTDAEQAASGRWPLLAPWLHSSALPVFAVLSVVVAVVFRTVELWLADYEELAADAIDLVRRLVTRAIAIRRWLFSARAPRSLFGLAFESRPPPLVV
jgi:hypothetical protein